MRMGFNDKGDFYFARGDLQQAFKCYARTRDYCTTSKHIIAMCLNVILVSIELGQFVHVLNYVQKAEKDVQDNVVLAKLRCAAGLAHLETRKYKLAARKVRPHARCPSLAPPSPLPRTFHAVSTPLTPLFMFFFFFFCC